MKSLGRLKDQVKSVVYKMLLTKFIFIDCMEYWKEYFLFFLSGIFQGK